MKKGRKGKGCLFVLLILAAALVVCAIPEWRHVNQGSSRAMGSVRNGSLENGYLFPYHGENFHYFSPFSYYVLNNAYAHHAVYKTTIDAYKTCKTTCPDITFRLMECANRDGGKIAFHRTHQNGLSLDFMVPKLKNGRQVHLYDKVGIWHYLWEFDPEGRLLPFKKVQIDFESMARHLLAIDDAARQNGLRIRKVIFKINLHDDLFDTPSGRELRQRGVYFMPRLYPIVDKVHDDHYHIDFEFLDR